MQQTTTGSADSSARGKVEDRGAGIMDQAKLKAGQIYNQANRDLNEQYERALGYGRRSPGKATLIAFGAASASDCLWPVGLTLKYSTKGLSPPKRSSVVLTGRRSNRDYGYGPEGVIVPAS
jgi:hypothetical protein